MEAKLSPEDYDLLPVRLVPRKNHNRPDGSPYFNVIKEKDNRTRVARLVMERVLGRKLSYSEYVDHIDHEPTNCLRENLRVGSAMQNSANMQSFRGNSKHKGVHYQKEQRGKKKWRAQLSLVLGKRKYGKLCIGNYYTEKEAALAYNLVAKEWYGSFALLNKVDTND